MLGNVMESYGIPTGGQPGGCRGAWLGLPSIAVCQLFLRSVAHDEAY